MYPEIIDNLMHHPHIGKMTSEFLEEILLNCKD